MSKNIEQVYIANPITSNTNTDLMYFGQAPYGAGNDAAMTYANFAAQFGAPYTPAALTKTDDANVTITLGGTPATALLQATSLTMGWAGQLSPARGGTGINNGTSTITLGGDFQMTGAFTFNGTLVGNTSVTFPTTGTLATTSQIPTGVPLTSINDTNVTLTLGGNPNTALINAASITAGWAGLLSPARGGTGINNGTSTITIDGNFEMSGAFPFVGNLTGSTNVTFPTSGTLATTSELTSPAQALYISNDGDDTNGTGTIEKPFATYEQARSVAVLSADVNTPYVIIPIGIFNITGDMILSPFVHISGFNINAAIFNITGSVVLDPLFDTTPNPVVMVENVIISAAVSVNLTFTVYQNAQIVFNNISTIGTPDIFITGSGTNSSCEIVVMQSIVNIEGSTNVTATNVVLVVAGSLLGGTITAINNSAITNNFLIVASAYGPGPAIVMQTTNTGTQIAFITSTNMFLSSFTLDGTGITVFIDSASYTTTPIYLNGASANNIIITSLSDGIEANTNFTPVNYAPTAGANFKADSVTGNLQGIDTTLGTLVAKGSLTWEDVPGNFQTAVPNEGYIISNPAITIVQIPPTVPEGSVIGVAGKGLSGWSVLFSPGQTCHLGIISGGTLSSTNQWDSVQILCVTADTEFVVISSVGILDLT